MNNATFTTLLTAQITNEYGNVYNVSLIHRSAGVHAAGSCGVIGKEVYMVRIQRIGDATFHGRQFFDKLDALDYYNDCAGVMVAV